MRTSSTNSIMIGIALCDLTVLSENVFERVNSYWLKPVDDPCVNQNTYWYQKSLLIGDVLRTFYHGQHPISHSRNFFVFEIRKSAKFASEALSKRSSRERHRTGHMILTMTVFYVIASAPAGASDFVQLFVEVASNSILEILVGYGSIFISVLFCLNATSHGIINFTMSTKYRDTVKEVLRLKKKKKVEKAVISVTRSGSHA
uniref:G protein-coupled receptor n=2 Tax=Caenorhabditis tropicalis TaxID=1561998 RepID=A0A1I7V2G8_9PELO